MFARFIGTRKKVEKSTNKEKTKNKTNDKDECLCFVETSRKRTNMKAIKEMTELNPEFINLRKLAAYGEFIKSKQSTSKITGDLVSSIKKDIKQSHKYKKLNSRKIDKILKAIDDMSDKDDYQDMYLAEITESLGSSLFKDFEEEGEIENDPDSSDGEMNAAASRKRDALQENDSSSSEEEEEEYDNEEPKKNQKRLMEQT